MKKMISVILALTILFSVACFHTNAIETMFAEESAADTDVFSISDDELRENFGIEQIVFPKSFEPVAYLSYAVSFTGEQPDYLNFVFTDSSPENTANTKCIMTPSPDKTQSNGSIEPANGKVIDVSCCYSYTLEKTYKFFITINSEEKEHRTVLDCIIKNQSLKANMDEFREIVSRYANDSFNHISPPALFSVTGLVFVVLFETVRFKIVPLLIQINRPDLLTPFMYFYFKT